MCAWQYVHIQYSILWCTVIRPQPAHGLLDTSLSDESSDEEYDPAKDAHDLSKDSEVLLAYTHPAVTATYTIIM